MYESGVSSKQRVNSALVRLTGHHLAKGRPGAQQARFERRLTQTREELQRTRASLQDAKRELQVLKSRQGPKKKPPEFPADYDEAMRETIRSVRGWTMTNREKLFALISAVRYIVRYDIPGDIAECGVWRGGSMQAVARELIRLGDTSRHLYLFDTYEGMTPPTEADVRWDGKPAVGLLEANEQAHPIWAYATLEDVQNGFAAIDYPADKIHYVQGKVEDTIPDQMPTNTAILRLDTDWYESSKHELDHMYDTLAPGGVLLLDDYGYWEGQRRATDEWIDRTNEPLLLLRMTQGRVAVKPRTT